MPQYLSNLIIKAIKHYYALLFLISLPLMMSPAFSNDGPHELSRVNGFKKSEKVAVLVGVENYKKASEFTSLNYAVDDVDLLKDTFEKQGYKVYALTDINATKKKVIDTINKAAKSLKNGNGTLVFSFSGHGLAQGRHNYLATYDARLNALENTAISVKDVIDTIRKTGVKRAVLFVDACRNNLSRGARTAGSDTLIRTFLGGKGIQVLYGTGNKKLSIEDRELSNGVFTHFVNLGLKGKGSAKEVDGTVDFDSLANYVMREVPQYTKDYHNGLVQQPWRGGEEHFGDFILAAHEKREVSTPLQQPVTEDTPLPPSPIIQVEPTTEKIKWVQEERARLDKVRRDREAQSRALKDTQLNDEIRKGRKRINTDHNLKKNALLIENRRKSNNLKSQFQKRMLDYDIALRHRLNTLPTTMQAKQRTQAESRLKSNTLQLKRILVDDNKQRQRIIQREYADKARLLERKLKLRMYNFERTLKKR